MKKIIASLLLLFALAATGAVTAQNVKFKYFFTDATLRINYLDRTEETPAEGSASVRYTLSAWLLTP